METIAVYWEPKIKTYGIHLRTGLSMVSFFLQPSSPGRREGSLASAAKAVGDLLLVFARPSTDSGMRLHLLFECRPSWHMLDKFNETVGARSSGLQVDADVELVYFQGPHFGDRYGIADAAFQALESGNIPILAAACTGASVYIVVPKQRAVEAKSALTGSFTVPGSSDGHRES